MNFSVGNSHNIGGLGNVAANMGKTKRQKFGIGSMIFIVLFGAVFLGVGLLFVSSQRIDSSWERVDAKVVEVNSHLSDGSTMYSPVYQYTVDNQSFRVSSGVSTSWKPDIGGTAEIAFNPADPSEAKVVGGSTGMMNLLVLIFPIIGALIIFGSIFGFIRSRKRSRTIDSLKATGHKITGVVVGINSTGATNGVQNYKVVVAADDGMSNVRNYTSDNLVGGTGLMAMSNFATQSIPIDVYLDPTNPEKYYVDVSDVPNLTPERIKQMVTNVQTHNNVPPDFSTPAIPQANNAIPPQNQPAQPAAPAPTQNPSGDFSQDLQNKF